MELTASQDQAVRARGPALQILACAGSGKTEVLARRVVRYLLRGTPPEGIVAFTFTEKAARELKTRIETRAAEADQRYSTLPPCAAGLFVGTIHSYCLHLLQKLGGTYELSDPLPEEREWALLQRFARRLGIVSLFEQTWPGRPVSVKRAVEVFRRSLSVAYDERLDRAALEHHAPAFAAVARRYERLLATMRLISFDQMIEFACNELTPSGRLGKALRGTLRAVLVDEYQDLNRAQEELLERLVNLGAELTVVGDDDQAIYQWRGGDVSLFLTFTQRHRNATRCELGENHRSLTPIVKVAARFATTIRQRQAKSITPVRTHDGPAIELMQAATPQDEARLIAERVRFLLERGHRPSDVAILCRSVRTSSGPIIAALRREGIPLAVVGRLSLLDRPEMALLARLFVWWAGGSWRPDEEEEVVTPQRLAADISILTNATPQQASQIVAELQELGSRLHREGVRDIVGTYLQALRIIGLPTAGPERQRQEEGLGQFSRLLADFEHAQRRAVPSEFLRAPAPSAAEEETEDRILTATSLEETNARLQHSELTSGQVFLTRLRVFLEQFASQAAEEGPATPTLESDAVNIMTIHQSKGLEFPIVFVPALVEGRFPSSRMGQEQLWYIPDQLFDKSRYQGREDDERRLFYVAVTRARELLVLSCFARYKRRQAHPSRFVKDLVATPEGKKFIHCAGTARPAPKPPMKPKREILETDFGRLLTYSECPYKYYLNHVCGFEP